MIEFCGEIAQVIKEELLKKARKTRGFWFLGLAGLFYVAIIPALFLKDLAFVWASLVIGILISLVAFKLILLPIPKKFLNNPWEIKIIINIEAQQIDYTQFIPKKDFYKSYPIKSVKKVIEKEYYYQLIGFGLPVSLVLEKRLLKKGTYLQLEEIFKNKIK